MKILLVFLPLVLASCGPLHSEKQDKSHKGKYLEDEIEVLKAGKTSGIDKSGADKGFSDIGQNVSKDTPDDPKENNPHQSPWQAKSPWQGKKSPVQSKTAKTLEVSEISYLGSGCSDESLGINISDDGKAFTLLFSEMSAFYDPADKALASSVNCNIELVFGIPHGWRFTVVTMDYRGFAELYAGDEARLKTEIGFDHALTITNQSVLAGALADDFEVRQEVAVSTRNWIGCRGSTGNLNLEVAVDITNRSNQFNEVSVDSLDGELTQKFALVWEECP